ncbi:MAG: DedA family protein [Gammaproteobacteria bacterium]|jgi:membrane protein DedA with SNARE-associated domain
MLEHLLQDAEPWLEQYGYAAVFGAMFLEGIGIPAPGLTVLIASVMLASRDAMHIVPVVAIAILGMLSGCQLAFLIGRAGGRRLVLRWGLVHPRHLRRLQRLFARRGAALLVAAPFFDGTRQYGSLVAGTAGLGWRRFTLYNLSGVVLWVGAWSSATDVFGQHLEPVLALVHRSSPWLFGAGVTALLGLLGYGLLRQQRYTNPQPTPGAGRSVSHASGDQQSPSAGQRIRKSVIPGALSYVVLALLISLPFWC